MQNPADGQAAARAASHPHLLAWAARAQAQEGPKAPPRLSAEACRALALEAGADDAGAVALADPALVGELPYVRAAFAPTQSLIAVVKRMHPEAVRSPKRSLANAEFHHTGDAVDEVCRRLVALLGQQGISAVAPPAAFPMEMGDFPERSFVVSHKLVAEAAGLGVRGLHRNLIHPRFGSFVLLGTVLVEAEVGPASGPLDFNPCIDCKLCVSACPVGAIEPDGGFRFSACYDHNYRDFMTGFTDFMEEVVESKDRQDFRQRVPLGDAMKLWQSLAHRPNYNAAYCLAVCPAGEDVLGPFLQDRAAFHRRVVKPLLAAKEVVYVVAGSDAERHARTRFPHKTLRRIRSSLQPSSARGMFRGLPLTFQRGPAEGWEGRFHFDLSGPGAVQATVAIAHGKLEVQLDALVGKPDLLVQAPAELWLRVVQGRQGPLLAVLTGALRLKGQRALLKRFQACFPR